MSVIAWDAATLCVYEELKSDLGEGTLSLTTGNNSQARKEFVDGCISDAKGEIKVKLLARLPDIYARSNPFSYASFDSYIESQGYTHEEVEAITDKFVNPDVLNLSARALSARNIYNKIIAHSNAQYQQGDQGNVGVYVNERDYYDARFKELFHEEWKLLKLDLDGDGETTDFERPRTRNSFLRV